MVFLSLSECEPWTY